MEFTEQQLAHIKMVVDYVSYREIRLVHSDTKYTDPFVISDIITAKVIRLVSGEGEINESSQK